MRTIWRGTCSSVSPRAGVSTRPGALPWLPRPSARSPATCWSATSATGRSTRTTSGPRVSAGGRLVSGIAMTRPAREVLVYRSDVFKRSVSRKEIAMKIWRFVYAGAVVSAAVIGLGVWSPLGQAIAKNPNRAPRFRVDPFWPKPLPIDTETNPAAATDGYRKSGPGASKPWVTGEVAGHGIDSKDHVFIVTRGPQGNLVSPETVIAHPSPSVVEFDREGNVVNAWPPNIPSATAPWWTAPFDPVGCDGSLACHDATRGVPQGIHGLYV